MLPQAVFSGVLVMAMYLRVPRNSEPGVSTYGSRIEED